MMSHRIHCLFSRLAALLCSSCAISLAGCGSGLVAPAAGPTAATIQGIAHGGQSPIQGGVVNLYATSSSATAYGEAANFIGTATTDANGYFIIGNPATSANCPAGQQAYITLAGGYPSGNPTLENDSILLMAALGDCANVSASTYVNVNELTTIAAGYALSGFMTTTANGSLYQANVSAPAVNNAATGSTTSAAGLAHAFLNAATLVNYATGNANSNGNPTASGTLTIAATVPAVEINTLGDILQTCVNGATGNSGCMSLFSYTPSITGVAPSTTLQSIINLARNPYPSTAAMASTGLFSLVSASPAFSPALSAPPPDWAMVVIYYKYGSSTLPNPSFLTLDANDTVYYTNSYTNAKITGVSAYGTATPTFSNATGITAGYLRTQVAADALGNIWVASGPGTQSSVSGSYLLQWSASSGGAPTQTFLAGRNLFSVAVDRANNVWIGDITSTALTVLEEQYTAGSPATYYTNYTATVLAPPYDIGIDSNQNIWPVNYGAGSSGAKATVLPNLSVGTTNAPQYTMDPLTSTVITPISVSFPVTVVHGTSVVFDGSGNAWLQLLGSAYTNTTDGIEEVIPTVNSSGVITTLTGQGLVANATLNDTNNKASQAAIDGAGTIFLPDFPTGQGLHAYSTVSGTASSNTSTQVFSPPSGYIGCLVNTSTNTCYTSGSTAGAEPAIAQPASIHIDSTGSVWGGINAGGVFQAIGLAAPAWPLDQVGKPALSPGLTTTQTLP